MQFSAFDLALGTNWVSFLVFSFKIQEDAKIYARVGKSNLFSFKEICKHILDGLIQKIDRSIRELADDLMQHCKQQN